MRQKPGWRMWTHLATGSQSKSVHVRPSSGGTVVEVVVVGVAVVVVVVVVGAADVVVVVVGAVVVGDAALHGGAPGDTVCHTSCQVIEAPAVHSLSS